MARPSMLAGLALTACVSTAALVALAGPAAAAEPACIPGFTTLQKETWLLRCRKIVPLPQKNAALVQANKADCHFTPYWNYGPDVSLEIDRVRGTATVRYRCAHIES